MSNELKLPALSKQNEQDLRLGDSAPAYAERTIQLREALVQIAILTAQVDGLTKDKHHWHGAYSLVFDQANEFKSRAESAEDELAALRESTTEPFVRGQGVIVNHPRYCGKGVVQYDTGMRKRMVGVLLGNGNTWEYEVDTVSRERILDTTGEYAHHLEVPAERETANAGEDQDTLPARTCHDGRQYRG